MKEGFKHQKHPLATPLHAMIVLEKLAIKFVARLKSGRQLRHHLPEIIESDKIMRMVKRIITDDEARIRA